MQWNRDIKKVGDGGGSGDDEVAAGGDILRRKIFE